jgi:hypothetical protein
MATWDNEDQALSDELRALEKYSPKDLTNTREFTREVRRIDTDQTLTAMDKYRYKKQLMRAVFMAKQKEISHHLDSFENYLLARKDVEAKTITLEAQKAIMYLEKEQLQMMKDIGLSHSEEISNTLIKAGTMLTSKLEEIEESGMRPEIKTLTLKNVRHVWEKTNARIMESVDTYMDELYEKERKRLR